MTRRSFFSKFATVAGALLAAPKLLKAAPAVPTEQLTIDYLNRHAAALDARDSYETTWIWQPHKRLHTDYYRLTENGEVVLESEIDTDESR